MTGAKTTRLASLQIAVFVSIGFWLLIQSAGSSRGTFVFGLTGFLFGIAIVFRAQQNDITRTIASVLVPIVGISLLAGVGVTGLDIVREVMQSQLNFQAIAKMSIKDIGLNIAAGIAIFGTVGTIAGGVGDRGVSRLVPTAIGNLLTVGLFLLGYIYLRSALLTSADIPSANVSQLASHLLQPGNTGLALVALWSLVILVLLSARMALSAVPLVELAPRRHEDRLKQGRDRLRSWLGIIGVLLILAGVSIYIFFAPRHGPGFVAQLRQTLGPGVSGPLFAMIQAEGLRYTLLAASLVFAAVTFAFRGLEYLTGSITSTIRRFFPAVIGGLVAVAIPIPITSRFLSVVSEIPLAQRPAVHEMITAVGAYGALVAIMGAAIAGVVLILLGVSFAGGIRFIPLRGSGGALAATGLAIGAIVLALVDPAPFPLLAIVTLSILTWNVGERGVTTRTELGATPPLTLETLHSLGGLIIAIPAMGFAWWIHTSSLASISAPEGTVIGVVASLFALSLLLVYIKG